MCAVQDSFKHWTAARRRIDYPIRECPVRRKATGGSGSFCDKTAIGQKQSFGYAGNSRVDRFLDIAAFALAQFKVRRDGLFW
jgi:hypothetical protein